MIVWLETAPTGSGRIRITELKNLSSSIRVIILIIPIPRESHVLIFNQLKHERNTSLVFL